MTIDAATLEPWIRALGVGVERASDDELRVTRAGDGDASIVVRRVDPAAWEVAHEQRVPSAALAHDWTAPWDDDPPAAVLERAARDVAAALPLVVATTHDDGAGIVVQFRAPVFEVDLSRQAFALTISSVLKAAEIFDGVVARRAEDVAAWHEFEATSQQRQQELHHLAAPLRSGTGPPTVASAAPTGAGSAGWNPTHEPVQDAQAWARPDPASPAVTTIDRGVPVQVTERQGDWAHVVCANGWSAWIDGRTLKESRSR